MIANEQIESGNTLRWLRLGMQIANETSLAEIRQYCQGQTIDGRRWLDTRPMLDPRECCGETIDKNGRCLAHAIGSGLVARHAELPHLVRIVDVRGDLQ